MANIWRVSIDPADSRDQYVWARGDIGTPGDNPWGRANPWAYDGAIWGYRALGDLGGSDYYIIGPDIALVYGGPVDYANAVIAVAVLNAGCNYDFRATGQGIALSATVSGSDCQIAAIPDTVTPESVIKGSMAVWGIARDILTFDTPGESQGIVSSTYRADGEGVYMVITTPSPDAAAMWASWSGEVIALWVA